MDDFNALPDLVIRGILPHLLTKCDLMDVGAYEYKKNFFFLHVSSRWRRLGVPLVYKTAFVSLGYSSSWISNIDLILELNMDHLVRKMSIYSSYEKRNDYSVLVEPLYDLFNLAFICDMLPNNNPITNITDLLQCLATRFPHVSAMDVSMTLTHSYARELTNQLLTTFSGNLVNLCLNVNTPVDMEYFPPALRHLNIVFSRFTGHSVPKIRNPENLHSLTLCDVHYNFYWEDLVSVPSEFTNLRSLSIDFVDSSYYSGMYRVTPNNDERSPPSRRLELKFPKLMDLSIQKRKGNSYLKFNPVQVPSSMNKVRLEISPEELNEFCDLPIEYIRHVSFRMEGYPEYLTDAFYSSTNRLLGEMGNHGGTTSVELYGSDIDAESNLDLEKIEWFNVTTLNIEFLTPSTLICLLAKLPQVISVKIGILNYGDYKLMDLQHVSQVEKIRIIDFRISWSVDGETEFIADILKQHSRVKSLLLPKHTVERVEKMIDKSASTYPHWKHITVSVAKRY